LHSTTTRGVQQAELAPRATKFGAQKPASSGTRESVMYHEAIEKVSKQVLIRERYDNFIGGKWVAPAEGRYFDNPSPVTGKKLCSVPRSTAADIELALDAAHKARDAWARRPLPNARAF
jgi:Aldehyde dehydrogenase family